MSQEPNNVTRYPSAVTPEALISQETWTGDPLNYLYIHPHGYGKQGALGIGITPQNALNLARDLIEHAAKHINTRPNN